MPFSQIFPPSPSLTESIRLFYIYQVVFLRRPGLERFGGGHWLRGRPGMLVKGAESINALGVWLELSGVIG